MLVVVRVHLDTDLGGDPDDVCALSMLLGWPDVEVVGITTVLDSSSVSEIRERAIALHASQVSPFVTTPDQVPAGCDFGEGRLAHLQSSGSAAGR